ncbi:hypothetical protein LEN26_007441 [Aphanomyces euteiches]|nr:hypothetical protein AeMF1_016181 [Aphanomyces euteiches]KAH9132354.1 hypothetical protein LEN26_007441 [Aphanomyces euteiches]
MTIYLVIFFVFVPLKLNLVTLGQSHDTLLAIEIGIGSFISIMLWVLTFQFLEVVPSASYLLPMMSNLLNDVWNFFILFGVFQMGLTITFYQLFRKTGDDSFGTITQSFITTYFVAFGELPLDSLNSFKDKDGNANKNEFLSACAVVLLMFHAAVVVILLLNVLLAMMNKTVDSGFEKAKTEALASYAKCILRLEESMNNKEHENIAMINFKDANGKPVLNPIFDENVPKSSIEIPDEQEAGIDAYQKKKKVWLDLMTKLQTIVGEEFTTFDNELLHVQHFVTFGEERIFPRERNVVKQTRDLIIALIEHSKNSRGQDSERSLMKLGESLKRELKRFDEKIKREWTSKQQTDEHKKCTVLHQMIYKVAIEDRMNTLKTNIQSHLESAISEAKTNAVVAPTLYDVIERFDMVEGILKNAKPADLNNGEENEQVELHKKVDEIAKQTEKLSTQMELSVSKVDALTKQIEDMAKQVESSAFRLEQLMQLMMDKTA